MAVVPDPTSKVMKAFIASVARKSSVQNLSCDEAQNLHLLAQKAFDAIVPCFLNRNQETKKKEGMVVVEWKVALNRVAQGMRKERKLMETRPQAFAAARKLLRTMFLEEKVLRVADTKPSAEPELRWASRGALVVEVSIAEAASPSPQWHLCEWPVWMPFRKLLVNGWLPWASHLLTLDPHSICLLVLVRFGEGAGQVVPYLGILPLVSAHILALREKDLGQVLVERGPALTLVETYVEPISCLLFRQVVARVATSPKIPRGHHLSLIYGGIIEAFLPEEFLQTKDRVRKKALMKIDKDFRNNVNVVCGISLYVLGFDCTLHHLAPIIKDFHDQIIDAVGSPEDYFISWCQFARQWDIAGLSNKIYDETIRVMRLRNKMTKLKATVEAHALANPTLACAVCKAPAAVNCPQCPSPILYCSVRHRSSFHSCLTPPPPPPPLPPPLPTVSDSAAAPIISASCKL